MDKKIYYIGGSPCSGKSTIAEMITQEFNACYFKVDDYLQEFAELAASQGLPVCQKELKMTMNEMWMRDPELQCEEEFAFYKEIGEFVFKKLNTIDKKLIITEGAAYIPELMEKVDNEHYICIIPTPDFQITHYQQREWIDAILKECDDKEKAFDNWMKRDILFAEKIHKQCIQKGIPCIINDSTVTIDELYKTVKNSFGL